jgi:hypothetical protein
LIEYDEFDAAIADGQAEFNAQAAMQTLQNDKSVGEQVVSATGMCYSVISSK